MDAFYSLLANMVSNYAGWNPPFLALCNDLLKLLCGERDTSSLLVFLFNHLHPKCSVAARCPVTR
jgi:hypothetical protein